MTEEHWFDTLNKLVTHDAPRRGVLSTVAALAFGQRLGATDAAAKNDGKGGKNKGNGKGKKDGNGKKNGKGNKKNSKGNDKKKGKDKKNRNDIPARCGEETCARELPEDQFVACAEKCGQCRIRDQFCVIGPDAEHPVKHATCCFEHQQCCQDNLACCDKTETCCNGGCCPEGSTCCDGACCGADNPYHACCDGRCTNTEYSQAHCGACGNPCGPGEFCRLGVCVCTDDCDDDECPGGFELCSGRCVNTQTDPNNCGSCGNPCDPGGFCRDGSCPWECCETEDDVPVCTFTTGPEASNPYHCGGCNLKCPGNQTCTAGTCECSVSSGTVWCRSLELCVHPSNCP